MRGPAKSVYGGSIPSLDSRPIQRAFGPDGLKSLGAPSGGFFFEEIRDVADPDHDRAP